MNLDLNDGGISTALYSHGARELGFMSIIKEVVSPGMVCLDVGANIGYTTLHMLKGVGKSGFVYAIEPDEHNINILTKNVNDNKFSNQCEIIQCVLSDKNKEIDFWIADKPNLNSVQKTEHSVKKVRIPAYDLTTFLTDKEFPQFIKMDVEGHEVKIYEGGLEYFSQNKGHTNILVEVHPQFYNNGNDFAAILVKYFKIGFYAKYVISTPVPQPKLFATSGYNPIKTFKTDGFHRGLYVNIKNEDLLRFACYENKEGKSNKIVRSFLLTRD